MADPEHLDCLMAVLRACQIDRWNEWRQANPDVKPDLQDADLAGADLREANLTGARLDGAALREARLDGANLRGACLAGADIRLANVAGADLHGASLAGADLRGAFFPGARLAGLILCGALAGIVLALCWIAVFWPGDRGRGDWPGIVIFFMGVAALFWETAMSWAVIRRARAYRARLGRLVVAQVVFIRVMAVSVLLFLAAMLIAGHSEGSLGVLVMGLLILSFEIVINGIMAAVVIIGAGFRSELVPWVLVAGASFRGHTHPA